jgi:predicted NBD/HSP70 family sugar kinase
MKSPTPIAAPLYLGFDVGGTAIKFALVDATTG